MEFVEQSSHFLASSNIGCVIKQQLLKLSDEILFDFHHKRSSSFARLWYLAKSQYFELLFYLKPSSVHLVFSTDRLSLNK